jgi:predicted anti-sigma-YlaC factor YlaD
MRSYLLKHLPVGMTCRESVAAVTDFLEDRMDFPERVRLHLHLRMCIGCHAYFEQMKHTIQALRRLPDETALPETREALINRFRTWHCLSA